MHHQVYNIHKLCVTPTRCIHVFCVDLRTNGDLFPIHIAFKVSPVVSERYDDEILVC